MNARSSALRGGVVAARPRPRAPARRAAPPAPRRARSAASARGLGQQQPARLEHRAHERVVERAAAAERVHEHVEPAVRPPVAHAHRVAVADLDERAARAA